MLYSEAAYFDGAHVQHIADYYEHLRIKRLRKQAHDAYRQFERRKNGRTNYGLAGKIHLASI